MSVGAANLEKPWGQQLSKINRFVVASLGVGTDHSGYFFLWVMGHYEANSIA